MGMSVYVIAEAGSNHVGKPGLARDLVRVAKDAGADAVKFQAFTRGDVWETPDARPATTEFAPEWFEAAVEESRRLGIDFLCTPFAVAWVDRLAPYVAKWKVSASHVGDESLLDACASTGKDILVSTAFLRPECIYRHLARWGATGLHCVHATPAPRSSYGLAEFVHRAGLANWGLSDHSVGLGTAVAAVGLGASVVEKHFKFDNQPASPDDGPHAVTPGELGQLVTLIREASEAREGELSAPKRRPGLRVWLPRDGGW